METVNKSVVFIIPQEKILFHIEGYNGLYTVVKYNRNEIVYTTKKLQSEGLERSIPAYMYQCLHRKGLKRRTKEEIHFHNVVKNFVVEMKKRVKNKKQSFYKNLKRMSPLQKEAYFGNSKYQCYE